MVTEETNPIARTATGEVNPTLPRIRTVTTTEIDIMTTGNLGIVGVLGTDRATEDMTMDRLGTDRDTVGIVGTMTGREEETPDRQIGMAIVTVEKDLVVNGTMAIEIAGTLEKKIHESHRLVSD